MPQLLHGHSCSFRAGPVGLFRAGRLCLLWIQRNAESPWGFPLKPIPRKGLFSYS